MKIVFSDIPMKKEISPQKYAVDKNKTIEYDGEVVYPINSVLARTMKTGEKVRVVLLSKDVATGYSQQNLEYFKSELNEINKEIGAEIEYVSITSPFEETREIHEKLLRDMIGTLEENAEIFADTTYGPKTLPIIIFAVLNFAEKFFKADIKNIVYGKVDFVDNGTGKPVPVNPVLYDLAPLYYLNGLTNTMQYKNSKEALKALDILLNI